MGRRILGEVMGIPMGDVGGGMWAAIGIVVGGRVGYVLFYDLAAYVAKGRAPVCGSYRGYRICSMGPPSSGATTILATLIQLERFDLKALGKDSPVAWHLIAESQRLAYADRARYAADADFVPVPVAGMIDRKYLAARSALIDPARTIPKAVAGTPPGSEKLTFAPSPQLEEYGTSHFSVVDRAGNAVSYTSTIESSFGSGLMAGGYFLVLAIALAGAVAGFVLAFVQ